MTSRRWEWIPQRFRRAICNFFFYHYTTATPFPIPARNKEIKWLSSVIVICLPSCNFSSVDSTLNKPTTNQFRDCFPPVFTRYILSRIGYQKYHGTNARDVSRLITWGWVMYMYLQVVSYSPTPPTTTNNCNCNFISRRLYYYLLIVAVMSCYLSLFNLKMLFQM